MFPNSTQKKNWLFASEADLNRIRAKANHAFVEQFGKGMSESEKAATFLTAEEELSILKQYEVLLCDFCKRFNPPMPRSVLGTSFHYFKRFYLNKSVMDFHPKEMLVTCVYLACKVEEFNVSIPQFVGHVRGDKEKASDIIINNELELMMQINYDLTIHNPFRPIEGFLIDIKTRTNLKEPERLRPAIDEQLDKTFLTDACLLYSPSQLALAAVLHSAGKIQENLDAYVAEILLGKNSRDRLANLIESVRKIRFMVKGTEKIPPRESVKHLEIKLDKCRNQDNNPDSEIYKQRLHDALNCDDDDRESMEYQRMLREQASEEQRLLADTSGTAVLSP